jgi:hypothetical protein
MSLFNNAYVQGASAASARLARESRELNDPDEVGCPDFNYELGRYVHVEGCDCAAREWE